jgi:hypothetical protein
VNPTRITVAFDKTTADMLKKISTDVQVSQSEIMRRALKFYNENKALEDPTIKKKIHAYLDMLLTGEHIILDVDHWLMFLRLIASSPEKEKFWTEHKEVARAHWEQLKTKVHSPEEMLSRLEICNFYRLTKNAPNDSLWCWFRRFQRILSGFFLRNTFRPWGLRLRLKRM